MGVFQVLGRALAVPVGGVLRFVHRRLTGRRVVLDVEIDAFDSTHQAQARLQRLRRVADDPRVAAVLFRLRKAPGQWATSQDFRGVIATLRAAGKKVYVLLETPGNALMWVASAADGVFMPPTSQLALVGVGLEVTFFAGALDKVGVHTDFEAAGAYKSFGEPFTRTFASTESREALTALLDGLQEELVSGVAEGRGLEEDVVREIMARAPVSAVEARQTGLVDALLYDDQLEDHISELVGDDPEFIGWRGWAGRQSAVDWVARWGRHDRRITVVHLEGAIVMEDDSSAARIRARSVVPLLASLRDDDRVRGVVLHVNSPGGDALASDLIWREVVRLGEDKPVVASFGDVSASGGYYLSAPAAEIMARSTTITGSIGVFGGKVVMGDALRKLGVVSQALTSSPNAALFSPARRFTADQRIRFKASLQRFYDGFVQRVATGRGVPEDEIEPFCRGRVWTGSDAKARGLVDREGDLFDAVERVRELSDLSPGDYERVDISPRPPQPLAELARELVMRRVPGLALGPVPGIAGLETLRLLQTLSGRVLAMLPFTVEID